MCLRYSIQEEHVQQHSVLWYMEGGRGKTALIQRGNSVFSIHISLQRQTVQTLQTKYRIPSSGSLQFDILMFCDPPALEMA